MRHGKTVWNEKGITQGRTNNRLSKHGIQETQEVAKNIKDVALDVIFVSPLMRTMQTANIINRFHNVKIIKDDDLIEIEQGIFTGRNKNSLSEEEKILKAERSPLAKMESYEDCYNRVNNFLKRLKNSDFKNVLVITHNCSATFIEDIVTEEKVDFANGNFLRRFKNAEIKKFEI